VVEDNPVLIQIGLKPREFLFVFLFCHRFFWMSQREFNLLSSGSQEEFFIVLSI
jgi:hypothetical protein